MGVGFGLMGDGNETAKSGSEDEVNRERIDRVWRGIEGV